MNKDLLRNFSIIAHIDHGKSTLADRLLEETKTLSSKQMQNQVLDSMDLERERGITIKSHPIQMHYKNKDGLTYTFNLIDTPGHVDFTYEVSRSLAACEGALLLVDAAQGVEAQTVSNAYLAIENDLTIIPVINKVDLPSAQTEDVKQQIVELVGCKKNEIIEASAKSGFGIDEIFDAISPLFPTPQSIIFDWQFTIALTALSKLRSMINIKGLHKSYQMGANSLHVLKGIDFEVEVAMRCVPRRLRDVSRRRQDAPKTFP